MNYPVSYTSTVSVPLPDDDAIRSVVGDTYDPGTTLNVIKMFAGTGDLYPALIGMVNAIFGTNDIDAKHREMIILRAAVQGAKPCQRSPAVSKGRQLRTANGRDLAG